MSATTLIYLVYITSINLNVLDFDELQNPTAFDRPNFQGSNKRRQKPVRSRIDNFNANSHKKEKNGPCFPVEFVETNRA